MKPFKALLTLIVASLFFSSIASARTCESLADLSLPHLKITAATVESKESPVIGVSPAMRVLSPFCRVAATISPASDSSIRIEVWMPITGWNHKFEGTGNGGFAGSIQYASLADGLSHGYAVANADMGTAPSTGVDGDALIGHPEKWEDWGLRATHEMTVAAKHIVQAYYQRAPEHAYFNGCSTGGEQGLMEAQRFPDDYDGIVAGAPANNRTRVHIAILWNFVAYEREPQGRIPEEKLPMLTQAVLDSCIAGKSVATDNFFTSDPSSCHWDPVALLCKAGDGPGCLTSAQVTTARNIYQGPIDPVTHASIYPGLERGSEFGWNFLAPQSGKAPYSSLFKWVFGSAWGWRSFDFDRDVSSVDERLAPMLNATNPDMSMFKAHRHKLIVYHGWADWLVPPRESVNFYERVLKANAEDAAAAHHTPLDETKQFFRIFMVPGMAHCGGGPGLNTVDAFTPLEQWVEKGIPPDRLIAARTVGGAIQVSRPVCAYPQVARYIGIGDSKDAASFSCPQLKVDHDHEIRPEVGP